MSELFLYLISDAYLASNVSHSITAKAFYLILRKAILYSIHPLNFLAVCHSDVRTAFFVQRKGAVAKVKKAFEQPCFIAENRTEEE